MTAIPHAAEAMTSASGRFEQASVRLLGAASGAGGGDIGAALVEMSAARTQFKAAVSVIRFSDAMWRELVAIGRGPSR